jgi:hypothetical protein
MRPATVMTPNLSHLGSHHLAGRPCQASVWVQTSRSEASATISGPYPVLGEAVERQVPQPDALQAADPVLGAGALPVA